MDVRGAAGELLGELEDYLAIFEAADDRVSFRRCARGLTLAVGGAEVGCWREVGAALVYDGVPGTHVLSLQAAVLHTIAVIETELGPGNSFAATMRPTGADAE